MLCETCEKREYCSELCPEAEAYVNQDYISLSELPTQIENIEHGKIEWPEKIKTIILTETEKKILTLLNKNLSRQEISYLLNIKTDSIRVHIYNLRKKFNNS